MNLAELSPERADVEGLLDELNDLLRLDKTGRKVQMTELDWAIGQYVSPAMQAAYHTRAMLILNSRGAKPHRFAVVSKGQEFAGSGVFYRTWYGNSNTESLQALKPCYVPKPAYFALMHTREFLKHWRFARSVRVPDYDLRANRAFIYANDAKQLTAVLWRPRGDARQYVLPAGWENASARDAFGFSIEPKTRAGREQGRAAGKARLLECMGLPTFVEMGVQVLNPIQWRCGDWDLAALKADFGQDLCFHSAVDNQQTLPFGTPEDVRAEVKMLIEILGSDGTGFIIGPCHNLQANTPVENIVALYESANEYGSL